MKHNTYSVQDIDFKLSGDRIMAQYYLKECSLPSETFCISDKGHLYKPSNISAHLHPFSKAAEHYLYSDDRELTDYVMKYGVKLMG